MINRRNKSKCNTIKTHSKKFKNYKSLAISPPREDTIPNQDKKFSTPKYQCLPSDVTPFPSEIKSLRNEENVIIMKLQILHILINMIHYILIEIIILKM